MILRKVALKEDRQLIVMIETDVQGSLNCLSSLTLSRRRDTRGNDYDDTDRRKGPPSGSRRETGKRNTEGWGEEDRDDYDRRRERPKRKEDDYDDYARDTRSSRGGRDRGETRRGEADRRRKDDAGSSDEERYRREKNRSRSPPSRPTRRRDDYDERDDERRRRDDSRERRAGKPKRRDDYDEEVERVKDRDRDRRQRVDGGVAEEERERDPYDKKGKANGRGAGWNEREMASGDEDSEAPEKWASVGRADGMVGPGSRSTGPPPSMPSVELDLSDMTRFLTRPLPRGAGIVQCHIVRNKSGTNKLYPIYSLYLKVFTLTLSFPSQPSSHRRTTTDF
jgi:hypothetical protein